MLRSWKIARAFGIDIYIHWTFWILPFVFIYATKAYSLVSAAFALVTLAVFVVIIVMHEFGHILTARAFGIGTKDVILTPLGGMAPMERMSENPIEEILISIAGPAVNVVIATILGICTLLFVGSLPIPGPMQQPPRPIANGLEVLAMIIYVNVVMAIFNMLPAFPMDGGRVFRAVLAAITNRVRATTIAVYVGTVVIGLFGVLFTLGGSFLALPLAVFIAFIGHMELMMVKRIDAHRKQSAYDRSRPDEPNWAEDAAVGVVPGVPPEPGFSGYTWDARGSAWIEWRDGHAVRASRMRAG